MDRKLLFKLINKRGYIFGSVVNIFGSVVINATKYIAPLIYQLKKKEARGPFKA